MPKIKVYTDGSASYKAGNGGWAFVADNCEGETAEFYGFDKKTTISVMELLPLKRALEWLPITKSPLYFHSDSQYVVNTFNIYLPEWLTMGGLTAQGKVPSHWELIDEINDLLMAHREKRSVSLSWLPGHRKYPGNVRADFLAGWARKNEETNWTISKPAHRVQKPKLQKHARKTIRNGNVAKLLKARLAKKRD